MKNSPIDNLYSSAPFFSFHFVCAPYSIQFLGGLYSPPPIHRYFQTLLPTTIFKVKIKIQEKTEGVLKTVGDLGEGLEHFILRFDPKSPNLGVKSTQNNNKHQNELVN